MGTAGRPERRPIIGVIGSHEDDVVAESRLAACKVGRWIARTGCHLLTGGGPGVMAAAAEGFCSVERLGLSIGILPAGKPLGYPNPWVELPIRTHLRGAKPRDSDSRNHINVRTCLALVALEGGEGTLAELVLALDLDPPAPVIAFLPQGTTIGGLASKALAVKVKGVAVARDVDEIFRFLDALLTAARKANLLEQQSDTRATEKDERKCPGQDTGDDHG